MQKPANAFQWQRYLEEEQARNKNIREDNNTAHKRSVASTKAIERLRTNNPTYGTIGISSKTDLMVALKPKEFLIYSKAGKK